MGVLESDDFVEVFRTINIEIRVISTEHDQAHPERPKINWFGSVGPLTTMVGSVHVTPDNHIRWHFVRELSVPICLRLKELIEIGRTR